MAKDIPDYMRGFDLNEDYGITTVSEKPNDDKPVSYTHLRAHET